MSAEVYHYGKIRVILRALVRLLGFRRAPLWKPDVRTVCEMIVSVTSGSSDKQCKLPKLDLTQII